LLEGVWPDIFVDEGILTVHVAALRKAFGDRKRSPLYIETVSRSGYRFIATVTHTSPSGAATAEPLVWLDREVQP
jgi:DNA-binding winged helix-turn-helix (wHTH) protein